MLQPSEGLHNKGARQLVPNNIIRMLTAYILIYDIVLKTTCPHWRHHAVTLAGRCCALGEGHGPTAQAS